MALAPCFARPAVTRAPPTAVSCSTSTTSTNQRTTTRRVVREDVATASHLPGTTPLFPQSFVPEPPKWVQEVSLDDLARDSCARKIPAQLHRPFGEALGRTCSYAVKENIDDVSLKLLLLLLLLPRVGLAKWAGDSRHTRLAVARNVLKHYPFLEREPGLAERVMAGLKQEARKLDTTTSDEALLLKTVKRHVEEGELSRGAAAVESTGIPEVTDEVLEALQGLHPASAPATFPCSEQTPVPPDLSTPSAL